MKSSLRYTTAVIMSVVERVSTIDSDIGPEKFWNQHLDTDTFQRKVETCIENNYKKIEFEKHPARGTKI